MLLMMLFTLLTLLLATHLLLYPAWMGWLARRVPLQEPPGRQTGQQPADLTVVIPCFNEARELAFKLDNLLQQHYPSDRWRIELILDGCTDASAEVAAGFERRFKQQGIEFTLHNHGSNRGKIHRLNQHLQRLKQQRQLVVLSDCSALLAHDALSRISRAFMDDRLGALCGRYVHGTDSRLAGHWARLNRNRQGEAMLGAVMGATGALMALRLALIQPLPPGCVNDDFELVMQVLRRGYRSDFEPQLRAVDIAPRANENLFGQRARIAAGNLAQLPSLLSTLPSLCFAARVAAIAGKGLRAVLPLLLPLWLIAGLGGALLLSQSVGVASLLAVSGVLAIAYASLRPKSRVGNLFRAVAGACTGAWCQLVGVRVGWRQRPHEDFQPVGVKRVKRGIDLLVSVLALILVLPLFPLIALAIKLDSPGSVLYRQMRVGARYSDRSELFYVTKFRSMTSDAEQAGARWAKPGDARVTRVGRLLRASRLDELPQLFQVLKGEMSIVGPRPERPQFCGILERQLPYYLERTYELRPGLTGLAQVNQSGDTSIDDVKNKLLFDHAYAASLGGLKSYLAMEAQILMRTLWVVVSAKGH
ncbi:Sugar transferase involved in LPS biosynthesis (colanic, teichoic acid) [Ferrimonas sediminum]|uniref:Sugar transferase involved in LPS biosynthesis (Colanic, teichoic acid) n=1 Tax=Ferrimonas sediminum TaxID=718193 RepID=A0A1G8S6U2_9GAMM|nr:sugar transferase [Ferrimonas sediminum]SDJ24917.1 Sugar transferase involved in LPS biosynthesis (colanic, teichoic acid) [Ferrimonas sediminum]